MFLVMRSGFPCVEKSFSEKSVPGCRKSTIYLRTCLWRYGWCLSTIHGRRIIGLIRHNADNAPRYVNNTLHPFFAEPIEDDSRIRCFRVRFCKSYFNTCEALSARKSPWLNTLWPFLEEKSKRQSVLNKSQHSGRFKKQHQPRYLRKFRWITPEC